MNSPDRKANLQPDPPVTEAVKAEVLRRLEAYKPGQTPTRAWADIYAEKLRKLAQPR